MTTSNKKSLAILRSLSTVQAKNEYFAGGRATAGRVSQVMERKIIHRYVGKVRGVIIEWDSVVFWDTQEDALKAARAFLADCKRQAQATGEGL